MATMKKASQIIIIEDDPDDKDFFEQAFREVGVLNPIRHFTTCLPAMDYLSATTEQPFLIISDINLPGISGLEMRRRIAANPALKRKCIPFVFLSTSNTKSNVDEAYELSVQGYFEKPADFNELKSFLKMIAEYWSVCLHPNDSLVR